MDFFDSLEQGSLFTAIVRYCNYQERCHQEVRNKLYELGAKTPEVEQLIALLIEKNLLNEERYARAFARGRALAVRASPVWSRCVEGFPVTSLTR